MATFRRNVVFMLLVLFTFFIGTYMYNYQHENAHVLIAKWTGGSEDCMASVSVFGGGVTYCGEYVSDYGDTKLQMLNEVIGYNMYSLAIMIYFGLSTIAFVILNRK